MAKTALAVLSDPSLVTLLHDWLREPSTVWDLQHVHLLRATCPAVRRGLLALAQDALRAWDTFLDQQQALLNAQEDDADVFAEYWSGLPTSSDVDDDSSASAAR